MKGWINEGMNGRKEGWINEWISTMGWWVERIYLPRQCQGVPWVNS